MVYNKELKKSQDEGEGGVGAIEAEVHPEDEDGNNVDDSKGDMSLFFKEGSISQWKIASRK